MVCTYHCVLTVDAQNNSYDHTSYPPDNQHCQILSIMRGGYINSIKQRTLIKKRNPQQQQIDK